MTTRLRYLAPGETILGFRLEKPGPRAPRCPPTNHTRLPTERHSLGSKAVGGFAPGERSLASFLGQGAVPQKRGRAGAGYASPSGHPKATVVKRRFMSVAAPWAPGAASVR